MSNYDMILENQVEILENQVEMVELTDEAMEAVAGGTDYYYEYNYNYGIKIDDSQIIFDVKRGNVNFYL